MKTHIQAILEPMAAFVKFDEEKTEHTSWQKDGSVFAAMPKMFINLSSKCRVDVGYRLLRRCVRHALDRRTESLDNKKSKLILYKGEVGIILESPIPASMKNDVYNGTTVLTKDALLCCECDCKSGSKNNQKVACVHSQPRGYLLSLLLTRI